jgi:hypothetical protein
LPKAFSLYLEYLGKSLLSPHFFQEFHRKSSSPHLSATRQIENLICTNRESLLGSSAWRRDFLKELQSRPFFMHKRSTASQYFYDCGSCGGNEGWDEERCQACGRTSQKPDHQVILFGPSYNATKSWESHWREAMPKVVLLNPTSSTSFSSSSPLNTPKKGKNSMKPSSSTGTGTTTKSSSGKKNKQFQAFQKETVTVPSVNEGTKRRLSLTPKDKKNEKKKNSIILSDSEEDKEKEKENNQKKSGEKKCQAIDLTEEQEEGGNNNNESNENDHLLWMKEEKKPISNKMIFGADEDEEEEKEEAEEDNIHDLIDAVHDSSSCSSDTSSSSSEEEERDDDEDEGNRRNYFQKNAANKNGKKKLQWWEKRLPRELNAENESKWQLSL